MPAIKDKLVFDAVSQRRFDENGFLHVAVSCISKETVNEYYGSEIPGWQSLGLNPDAIYKGYRPGKELARGAATFNGLNILSKHVQDDASNPPKDLIIGSMGTDARFEAPYLKNSLIIKDAAAIARLNIRDESQAKAREISASYRYQPIMKQGIFNGKHYDFIMTDIRGNHIALVEAGRAGSDVVVADEMPKECSAQVRETKAYEHADFTRLADKSKADEKGLTMSNFLEHLRSFFVKETQKAKAGPVNHGIGTDEEEGAGYSYLEELLELLEMVDDPNLAKRMGELIERVITQKNGAARMDNDPDENDAPPAMDARRIAARVEASINAKMNAISDVRPLVGELDPLAFDSAAGVYRKALQLAGYPSKARDLNSLRDMCKLASDARLKNMPLPAVSEAHAFKQQAQDPNFAHLDRIRKA